MPPKKKEAASKKNVQKKKASLIEDKTFGLKNKKNSKKMQDFVKGVERNVMNSGDPKTRKMEEQRKKAKEDNKARKKAAVDEQNALFGEALMAVTKKGAGTNQKDGKVEAKGRDHEDDAAKKSTSRAMKMMFQMDASEMRDRLKEDPDYVPTIEDEIEDQRQLKVEELKKAGNGTPVTPETFAAWQEGKRLKREAAAKKKVEAELRKKKGGKGLSVLTGRDLYMYKKELFQKVDNDENETGMSMEREPDEDDVDEVAAKVESDLFLQGGDLDDLDDLEDD
jgi:hypothetical protein